MNKSIFKTYDIRGVYPTEINKDVVSVIARACVHILNEGEIIVAYDVRHGSEELAKSVSKAITAEAQKSGKKTLVKFVGPASTPMFYFLVNHFKTTGGCMITASHNPKEYNGMKVVREGAVMIPGIEILDFIDKHNIA
jgi:phosphomannomutase